VITKDDKRLARQIRLNRRRLKLTQEELASKVGVTPKYIQYIEASKRKPALKLLYKIAKVLGVKVKDLFTF
jgi:putative transcriptional regulator